MELTFEIPDDELERVGSALCKIAGHPPCQSQECLLEQVGGLVVARVLAHEKFVAAKAGEASVLPLRITPQTASAGFDPLNPIKHLKKD